MQGREYNAVAAALERCPNDATRLTLLKRACQVKIGVYSEGLCLLGAYLTQWGLVLAGRLPTYAGPGPVRSTKSVQAFACWAPT